MPKPKRLSQQAIAKATGVSRATVSLILRGGTGASKETHDKVMQAAEKMGYRPNALIHTIRSGKSRTVGVLMQPHDSYWRDVLYGIHDRLVDANHLPFTLWNNESDKKLQDAYGIDQIHRLLDRWVDGVILWPHFASLYAGHLQEFTRRNLPVVTIDQSEPSSLADSVSCDEDQIAELAVSHLQELGHRNFLILSGPFNVGWADARTAKYVERVQQIPGAKAQVLRFPYNADASGDVAEALRRDPGITGILACTDDLAAMAYRGAQKAGRQIPNDLSIIGVADLDYAKFLAPALTTIRQNGYAVGQKAAQVELERSAGILVGPPKQFSIPVELIARGSTGKIKS